MPSGTDIPATGSELDPRTIVTPNAGFDTACDQVDDVVLGVYGIVLDCPQCVQPTTAFLAFLPRDGATWDQTGIVLCNTELSLAVADASTLEITHIVNTVGRPGYPSEPGSELVNRCFHCDHPLTGDDLAVEVRRTYLDGLVELGAARAPRRWVEAGAGSFVNRGDVSRPDAVPDFLTVGRTARRQYPPGGSSSLPCVRLPAAQVAAAAFPCRPQRDDLRRPRFLIGRIVRGVDDVAQQPRELVQSHAQRLGGLHHVAQMRADHAADLGLEIRLDPFHVRGGARAAGCPARVPPAGCRS